jgi:redox-sensitive bicupin YhaK (pirin superfamily)
VHQDVRVYSGLFDGGESARLELAKNRRAYVHVARGAVHVSGIELTAGDALKLTEETVVEIGQGSKSEVLVFDLP